MEIVLKFKCIVFGEFMFNCLFSYVISDGRRTQMFSIFMLQYAVSKEK